MDDAAMKKALEEAASKQQVQEIAGQDTALTAQFEAEFIRLLHPEKQPEESAP